MYTFSDSELQTILARGISIETINKQLENFEKGFPFVRLDRPAKPGDGILTFTDESVNELARYFEHESSSYSVIKFVPASGAASRMFKNLFSFLENKITSPEEFQYLLDDKDTNSVGYFLQHLKDFAFYKDLELSLKKDGKEISELINDKEFKTIISHLLEYKGLNYGNLPKGLLKFHKYGNSVRTSVEEHMVEGSVYSCDVNRLVKLHFTISPEHKSLFIRLIEGVKSQYEDRLKVKYDISYSIQKPSSDTIAVDMDNVPFRDEQGGLVFRPGGHGALIENLIELEEDIVFIKNIDNVVPDHLRSTTYLYKKALGGLLIKLQKSTHAMLARLENSLNQQDIDEITNFAKNDLCIQFPLDFEFYADGDKQAYLTNTLNRPIRICGMVKNQGEPGGGPFWLKDAGGKISLQIVESSQVDLSDHHQKEIFSDSTHFNPVDLVCAKKNYKGESFDLISFIDGSTGFISVKSKDGRNLKAQELPGLWNGAMAYWITLFVEVPLITFNPVKTVNDLLRPEHQ
jgi:hypothetical protein